jgi:hypothetical protein
LVAGENDLAQNPFNLSEEHGPSLFDARHRFVLSGSYQIPFRRAAKGLAHAALAGWQLNTIANFATGTPFTVYDSANVALQGSSPEITGFYSSRPNLVADPNTGSHTADRWISRSAFQRLDPVTQAGQLAARPQCGSRARHFEHRLVTAEDLRYLRARALGSARSASIWPTRQLRTTGQRRGFQISVACWRQAHRG